MGLRPSQETAKAQVFTRLFVIEGVVPLIKQGEFWAEKVLMISQVAVDTLTEALQQKRSGLLTYALEEVLRCARALLALLCPNEKSTAEDVQKVADTGDKTGHMFILKSAIQQSPYYKKLQAEFLEVSVAEATLRPPLNKACEALTTVAEDATLEQVVSKIMNTLPSLPVWRSRLRKGATTALERSVVQHSKRLLQGAETVVDLEHIVKVTDLYLSVPVTKDIETADVQESITTMTDLRTEALTKVSKLNAQTKSHQIGNAVKAVEETPSSAALWQDLESALREVQQSHLPEAVAQQVAEDLQKRLPFICKACTTAQTTLFNCKLDDEARQSLVPRVSQAIAVLGTLKDHMISKDHLARLSEIEQCVNHMNTLVETRWPMLRYPTLQEFFEADKVEGLATTPMLGAYFAMVDLEKKLTQEAAKLVYKSLHAPISQAKKEYEELRTLAKQKVPEALRAAVATVEPLAGGAPGGKSWKESLSSDAATWQEVKRSAKPFLESDVSQQLFSGFQKLQKETAACKGSTN